MRFKFDILYYFYPIEHGSIETIHTNRITVHSELEPLHLTPEQPEQIIAFLKTLVGPINADPVWFAPP